MLVKSAKIILIIYQKNTTDKLRERGCGKTKKVQAQQFHEKDKGIKII